MIIGDPYKFALIFDEVKEWCYARLTFRKTNTNVCIIK